MTGLKRYGIVHADRFGRSVGDVLEFESALTRGELLAVLFVPPAGACLSSVVGVDPLTVILCRQRRKTKQWDRMCYWAPLVDGDDGAPHR